ncbi:MAG: AEC family transporter [Deinococcales bacterium]
MDGLLGIFVGTLLPVFALVGVGAWAAKPLELQARTLSRAAYYLFIPAFVFQTLSSAKVDLAVVARVSGYTILVHLLVAGLGFVVAKLLRRPPATVAAYVLIAVFGNVGNMGLPIVQFDMGKDALPIGVVYFLAILACSFVLGVAAANWHKGLSLAGLLSVLKTPALVALVPAIMVNVWQIPIPLPISRGAQLLADAMIPVMLVGLGIQLKQTGLPRFTTDVWLASAVRLVGGAALAFLLAPVLGVTGLERSVGIIQAAMPTAVLASIIALENDLEPNFVTASVMLSTLLALPVLMVVLALV